MKEYLEPTICIDSNHPSVEAFAKAKTHHLKSDKEKAIALYYAVRDDWRYNPYNISFNQDALKASAILDRSDGHCIDKAVLLIAFLRAVAIPARLCLASVRNHIATEKFEDYLESNVLVPHGYVEIWLDEKWVKVTPAFNKALCEKLKVDTLEFDGETEALFQEYNHAGGKFMEYLDEFGAFANVPIDYMLELMKQYYPAVFEKGFDPAKGFIIS